MLFFHTSFFFSWHKPPTLLTNLPRKTPERTTKKLGKIYITLANAIFALENMQAAVSGLMNIPHYILCVCVDVYTTLKEFIPFPLPSGFNWRNVNSHVKRKMNLPIYYQVTVAKCVRMIDIERC